MVTTTLAAGRDAFSQRAWGRAYAQLSAADDGAARLDVDDLERLAVAAYLIGRDDESADLWSRAHTECLRVGDRRRAARCSFWLILDLLSRGQLAQANGWRARAQHLLDECGSDCPERGLLLVLVARGHVKTGDMSAADAAARQAADVSRCFDDPELHVFSRLMLAQIRARLGDAAEAASLFDEIMVAVTLGGVSPIAVGVAYCAVIDTCCALFDLGRAREWTLALSAWCDGQPDLVPFRGNCLVHRVELLRLSGAWSQALTEAEHARRWLTDAIDRLEPASDVRELPSFTYPIGAAWYQLAEMHRLRGDFANATAAYRQASQYGHAPEPGLALLRLAQGRHEAAAAAIRRVLSEAGGNPKRPTVLAACVEVMIAASDLPAARAAADELQAITASSKATYLRALSAQAAGSVRLAEGDPRGALDALRIAWAAWQDLEAPWEAARLRVLLGLACRALGDEDAAGLEFDAAQRVFERLAVVPDLARVAALRGLAGPGGARGLTHREKQVIVLVAAGKTNRAIAQELAISERTVDRHVSNILSKLDLPSRSAATAFAYAQGLV
jgi:ATP/maltotriose-dependent transcriptional regulator MalT